ncbi:AsnC family transcriptional regulator [Halostagnicola sp. A-GB9-2]|uniref:Lrp/AsnC family transcriptional regulator n=1 Tax=Halostagnicola sp. A-GB9-2 TaxID=3048066 RepID=UPI0024C099DD|nr:AsnC family transcriptional regulator [Halostagnicola sp. A-GB9-2]MDJ1432258.1 AsnC family transcriptional regulator [Halostagnicola sp. A-GB9-2]
MAGDELDIMKLDDTDRKILFLLQEEMRTNLSHEDIAEQIDVSSSTVGNRIRQLKEREVLQDYQPKINYEEAGIPHHILFVCTAPIAERTKFAKQATDIDGVVNTRELLTGQRNLHVEIVCLDAKSIEVVAKELDELGLEIEMSEMLREEYSQPFNHFGPILRDESDES